MKNYDDVRYNFYTAMAKVVDFYKGYLETKKQTKEEIVDEAHFFNDIFDEDLYIDTEVDMYEEADELAKDIKTFFSTPIKTIGDLVDKGQVLMELQERVDLFEYWYC